MVKRSIAFLLSVSLVLCLSGCFLENTSFLYTDCVEQDGFNIVMNKTANCCFVSSYACMEYTENMEITIPDEYEGVPIKRLGGYYGRGLAMPFCISLAYLYENEPENSDVVAEYDPYAFGDAKEQITEDVVFYLNIGKNVEVIELVNMGNSYPHINQDGSVTVYWPVVYINCSDENKFFYSMDGKLYNKETDELVSDFMYAQP